jgi:hypothetical protein
LSYLRRLAVRIKDEPNGANDIANRNVIELTDWSSRQIELSNVYRQCGFGLNDTVFRYTELTSD